MTDTRSPRPSPLWIAVGLLAAGGVAWAVGVGGGSVTTPAPSVTPALPSIENPGTGTTRPDLILEAETFWEAVGAGDHDVVRAALDVDVGPALTHYAAFATTFEAGLVPENCRAVAEATVRCTLLATNADLVDLYWSRSGTTEYVTSAAVTFTDRGVDSFQMPGVVNAAASRLFGHARATTGIPAECDRINHDAVDLPPFSTAMAQTQACAGALIPFLADALAAEGS